MKQYEKLQSLSVDDLAWFIFAAIKNTEDAMLDKLAVYGIDVTMVSLDPDIRHAQIVEDLLKEVDR